MFGWQSRPSSRSWRERAANARQGFRAFPNVFCPAPLGHRRRAHLLTAGVPVTAVSWLRLWHFPARRAGTRSPGSQADCPRAGRAPQRTRYPEKKSGLNRIRIVSEANSRRRKACVFFPAESRILSWGENARQLPSKTKTKKATLRCPDEVGAFPVTPRPAPRSRRVADWGATGHLGV